MPIWSCGSSALGPDSRIESGTEFQAIGDATKNDRCPNVLRWCRGTTSWHQLADRRRWRLGTSDVRMPQSTKYWEHGSGGTNKLWLRAYTEDVDERPANVAQSGADRISRDQTSTYQWWLMLQHSAHAWSLSVINRGDPTSTVLQWSTRDAMKACTCVVVDSVSKDR